MKNRWLLIAMVTCSAAQLPLGAAQAATVGYWRFEEGSGTTVDDSSVNNNDGMLLDGAAFSTDAPAFGPVNLGSLELDGVNDTMEVPDAPALDITGAFTLEAFVRPTAAQSATAGIVVKRNVAGNGVSYGLFFASSDSVRLQVHTATLGTRSTAASPALTLDTWHHVAGVSTGTELRLYVDHNLVGTNAFSGALEVSTNPLVVGDFGALFAGRIDEVRLSNVALSPSEFLGGIFGDGFESGNTTAWSSAVP